MPRVRQISLMEPHPRFSSGRLLEKHRAGTRRESRATRRHSLSIRLRARQRLRRSLLVFHFDFVHNLLNVRNVLGYLLDGRAFRWGGDGTLQSDDALVTILTDADIVQPRLVEGPPNT